MDEAENNRILNNLKTMFELSNMLAELKIIYYCHLYPGKTRDEVTRMVYQEFLDNKNRDLQNANAIRPGNI